MPAPTRSDSIAKLGHVAARTPDLEESLWFFRDVLQFKVVEETADEAYLRGMRDWEHHTLALREASTPGVDHVGWRTTSPEALDRLADRFEDRDGFDVEHVPAGTEPGQGDAIRIDAFGHPYEFYYDVEKPDPPQGERSKLHNRVYSQSEGGPFAPRRIDHAHVQDDRPSEHVEWFESLGFGVNERFRGSDDQLWGWWLSVTAIPHDIAVHRNEPGEPAQFHHVAFHVDSIHDLWQAADVLREHGLKPAGGPGRHAITAGDFLYVSDPASGLGVEFFAGPGYLNFEPDWDPIEWTVDDIGGEDDHQWIGVGPDWDGMPYE